MFINFFIIFVVFIIFLLFSYALPLFSIAPWVPCRKRDLERINKLANLKSGQVFYELGFGDGRVCRYIAKQNPNSRVVGVELSFPMFLWAKIASLFYKQKNLQIKFGNALKTDLSEADVVYIFALDTTINKKLKKKFQKELKKGAKILSYVFSIVDWGGKKTTDKPDKNSLSIFLYEV